MRLPVPFKVMALAVLGVGTAFATKAILAAAGAKPPPARASATARPAPTLTLTAGPPGAAPQAPPGARPFGARGAIRNFEHQAIGDTIHVAAEGDVYSKYPNMRFVWSLRLFDVDDRDREAPLYEKIYDDQIFDPQQLPSPQTFDDAIRPQLPPGDYQVELALSLLHPQLGLDEIRDPGLSQGRIKAANRRVVTIE